MGHHVWGDKKAPGVLDALQPFQEEVCRRPAGFWKVPTVDINVALQAAQSPSQLLNSAARHTLGQTPGERAGQALLYPNHEVQSRRSLPAPDFARREDVRNGSRSRGATASGRTGVLVIRQGQRRPRREKHRHSLAEKRLEGHGEEGTEGQEDPREHVTEPR